MVGKANIDRLFRRYLRRGEARLLGQVFDAAAPEMLRVARGFSRVDEALAEDAVQSAFLVAMQKAGDFDAKRRVMPWLLGILANELRRERSRAERTPHPQWLREGAAERHPEDPEAAAADAELKALIHREVEELPETYRDAVREHLFSTREPEDVAARLGITRSALHVRVHRGLGLLRGRLPVGAALTAGLVTAAPRGLAAMRGEFLSGAASAAASGATGSAAAGAFASAKAVAAVATLAGLAAGGGAVAAWQASSRTAEQRQSERFEAAYRDTPLALAPANPPADLVPVTPQRAELDPVSPRLQRSGPLKAAPEAPSGDAALTQEDWLALYQEAEGYNELFVLGSRLIALPKNRGLDVARQIYPQLTPSQRKQFGKPFVFNAGASYGLEVVDWIATDEDPEVREYGYSFLRRYALRDFSKAPETYASWREATAGLSRDAVLLDSARYLAAALSAPARDDAYAALVGSLLPTKKTLKSMGLEDGDLFAGTDFRSSLLRCLSPRDPKLTQLALTWLPLTDAGASDYRTFVVPLLDGPHARLRRAAAVALASSGQPFAADELKLRFQEAAQPDPDQARSLAFWSDWLQSNR